MLTAQIYYEFVKEVEKMRSNINDLNSPVNRNTQILTKQIMQMKYDIDNKNREIDRQLNDLKRLITLLSQKLR
jgi:DNA-binding transcriptional regulator GbsR (MarR family)